ncbi:MULTISPECIES: hypothetical protein [unclassified Guyparkeria]|uniref:hypothetical protein n=1 Tax=unclassified Guyparkeria TaxID=2626246 RepID=UPI0012E3B373|nr:MULTISPECIES: hypothetical protein [unclassified Guyparkeria]
MVYRFVFFVIALFSILSGCASNNNVSGPPDQYFEMVDKSGFYSTNAESFKMHWEKVDEYCMSFVRQRGMDAGFRSMRSFYQTYANCMGANNFRRVSPFNLDRVVEHNKEKYGFSYVIQKHWGG